MSTATMDALATGCLVFAAIYFAGVLYFAVRLRIRDHSSRVDSTSCTGDSADTVHPPGGRNSSA